MKQLYYAAVTWAALGLTAGLFYRIYTHTLDYSGPTELAVMHTHLLALGMLAMLIVLGLEKSFHLSRHKKSFNLFFWNYNGGLLLTVIMMLVIGIGQVSGVESSPMLNGIAGLGHIIITVGIVFLFVVLGKSLASNSQDS